MKTPKHSLRKIVAFLNNPDEDGGFWLPNIQRAFVWNEDQICRLFDSILREYPISTLLLWKTRAPVRQRKFIDNYRRGLRLGDFYVPENERKKCLVLDGQQRLQSLYIGLWGSYEGRELCLDIMSGELAEPDDVKYKFAFRVPVQITFPWIKFKNLVFSTLDPVSAALEIIEKASAPLDTQERGKVSRNVGIVFKTFHSDDGISYQELDSTENADLYSEDDVVEVFIRANSGGTRLEKSDLLFALLSATWDEAGERMEDLLAELNRHGFGFTRDFVLKTCLTLLGQGARYEVSKFRKPGVRETIETKWNDIIAAIKDVLDFLRGRTFIRCGKALPSYLPLITLVYLRYHCPDAWKKSTDLDSYLVRVLLTGAFSGRPDDVIDRSVDKINETRAFDVNQMLAVILAQGRTLRLTEDRLWSMGYGSDTVHLLFNLWYRGFHYTPSFEDNMPQIDHIFPQSALLRIKALNPLTGVRNITKYKKPVRDQLGNCMLLTQSENGPGGKGDKLPEVWFADKTAEYLDMHLIPGDPELWKLDRFEDFIAQRKQLIKERFKDLLIDG